MAISPDGLFSLYPSIAFGTPDHDASYPTSLNSLVRYWTYHMPLHERSRALTTLLALLEPKDVIHFRQRNGTWVDRKVHKTEITMSFNVRGADITHHMLMVLGCRGVLQDAECPHELGRVEVGLPISVPLVTAQSGSSYAAAREIGKLLTLHLFTGKPPFQFEYMTRS